MTSADSPKTTWWATLPGIITAVATLVGAITALIVALGVGHRKLDSLSVENVALKEQLATAQKSASVPSRLPINILVRDSRGYSLKAFPTVACKDKATKVLYERDAILVDQDVDSLTFHLGHTSIFIICATDAPSYGAVIVAGYDDAASADLADRLYYAIFPNA